MQENSRWSFPVGPLGRLTQRAAARAALLRPYLGEWRDRARDLPRPPSLRDALRAGPAVAVIAEIKRRSPSKGTINAGIRAADRAAEYEAAGARALSVLTEPTEFGGAIEDLREVAGRVTIPILKKDFHVDEAQVWEARGCGASAILFIARALSPGQLQSLVGHAIEAGLDALVEIRSAAELEQALTTPATVIGVNARDLETLKLEAWVTERLIPSIPAGRVRVAESGMSSAEDVVRAASLGADAVLIGSSLSTAADADALLRALASIPRGVRAG